MPRPKKTMMDSVINFSLAPLASSSPQASSRPEATFEEWAENFKEDSLKKKTEIIEKLLGLITRLPDSCDDIIYYNIEDEDPMPPEPHFVDEAVKIINKAINGFDDLENIPPHDTNTRKRTTSERKSRSRSVVPSLLSEMPPPVASSLKRERTTTIGSNKRGRRSKSASATPFSTMSSSKLLCTPHSRGRPYKIASVTPGPGRHETPSVLRKPVVGEQVISLSGSPILVQSSNTSEEPSVHIPLPDGRVFAVMAQEDLNDLNIFPDVNPETMQKLKMLHKFLEDKVFVGADNLK